MNEPDLEEDGEADVVNASEAGCEAVFIPGEDRTEDGHWHFAQKYDEGTIWKRWLWPWIALTGYGMSENRTVQAFSKNVKHAEKYLREEHPEALIPPSLLKDSIRESFSNEDDAVNPLKGELLGLGVVNKIRGRLGQLFLAFPTTESFSTVGIAPLEWRVVSGLDIPFLSSQTNVHIAFKQPILQIAFPPSSDLEDLKDYFAVRTISEVSILRCCWKKGNVSSLSRWIDVPITFRKSATSVADVVFSPSGNQLVTLTSEGGWTVFEFEGRWKVARPVQNGSIQVSENPKGEVRNLWWKIEWIRSTNDIVICQSKSLHVLHIGTGVSRTVLEPERRQQFRGIACLPGAGDMLLALLTTSEILIMDHVEWKMLLRQKHRRDPDPSLLMKCLSRDEITSIFIYSRLNPLITVHQLSENFPLSWLDTPFQLPLPRHDPDLLDLPPLAANLGLVIIPSKDSMKEEDSPNSSKTSFTTYRLQPDVSIVGDMYGSEERLIESISIMRNEEYTETLDRRLSAMGLTSESEAEVLLDPSVTLDFTPVVNEVGRHQEFNSTRTVTEMREEMLNEVEASDFQFATMLKWKQPEMSGMNPDTLATTIEQVAHELGERGYEIRSLHLDPDELEPDPEHDPGSIISIYEPLMSKLPSRGLRPEELASKVHTIKETAIDIGLANIGILKPSPSERTSLKSLGKFVSLDPALGISDGAKHLIDKWCETPQIPSRTKVPEKRKRPQDLREPLKRKFSLSQGAVSTQPAREILSSQTTSEVGLVTMSQPERGRQGTRKSHRAKTRRSGF